MRDLRHANVVLEMAHKDFKALQGMTDPEVFHEEIFGFHAQQAIEKSLKAWLAILGKEYPLTHDISELLGLLTDSGQDVEQYWDLVEYNAFAVTFRYESLAMYDESLDRKAAIKSVEKLLGNVWRLIDQMAVE